MPYRWSLAEATGALEASDRGPTRQLLEAGLAGRNGLEVADFAVFESASWWNADARSTRPGRPAPTVLVQDMVGVAAAQPDLAALLLLYVRFEVSAAWEQAWTGQALAATIDAAARGWALARHLASPADRMVADQACALLTLLAREIDTETISTAGSLREWSEAARVVADEASRIGAQAHTLPRGPLASAVRRAAQAEAVYYRSVARAAWAADSFCRNGRGDLRGAMRQLADAEAASDIRDSSELRAHRLALRALDGARGRSWLSVDHGRVVVVYPFGTRDIPTRAVVDLARTAGLSWELAGVPVVAVRGNLPINDIWDGDDSLDRSYTGTALRLPEVYLGDARDPQRLVLRPQVWLSDLGNHSLRLDFVIQDAGPQRLFDVLKLTSPEAGDLRLVGRPLRSHMAEASGDRGTWSSLLELASDTLAALQERLRVSGAPKAKVAFGSGTARVVVAVDRASSWHPSSGQRTPIVEPSALADCFGYRLLTHPVDVGVHAIAQWAAYSTDHVESVPVRAGSPTQLVVTENSAVVAAFGRPNWAVDVIVDLVTFAFTLGGLFEAWHQEIAAFHYNVMLLLQRLRASLPEPDTSDASAHREVLDIQAELQRRQFEMHEFLAGARASLLFIVSPSLVSSPMTRVLLDEVLDRTGFARLRTQFDSVSAEFVESRVAAALGSLERHVAAAASADQRRREARSRVLMDALLAAVAVTGVAGVAGLVQSGFDIGPQGSAWLIAVVVLLATLIGALTLWAGRGRAE